MFATRKTLHIRVSTFVLLTLALSIIIASEPAKPTSAVQDIRTQSVLQGTSGPVPLATASGTGTYFDHVVVIIMENEGVGDICKQTPPPCLTTGLAPYMANLANNYTIGSHYLSLINTSQPNYIALISGSMQGCTLAGCPVSTAPNLVDRFEAAGLTWKGYFENQALAQGCDASAPAPYEPIHNPFISFQDITNNTARCNKLVQVNPSTCGSLTDCALVNDLNNATAPPPNFMWLTPNDCDNMRSSSVCTNGCTSGGSATCITDGDNYLKSLVPKILNSSAFNTTRSALFLTFDEGNGYCPLNNSLQDCLYVTWAGPVAKTGFGTTNLYNHYSFTKMIEVNWNLASFTSNDANASPMTEFFKAQSPDFTISSSPSSLTFQSGSSATSTIQLTSLSSFSGSVALSASVSPSGLTALLNPTSVNLSSGGSATSTLTASSSTPGSYTVTVTGTSGSLSHSTTVTVTVTGPTSVLVASDGAMGPSSLGTGGATKLIQDSAGKMIAVYADSSGRIGLAYANSDPISGGWSTPVKSSTPISAYIRPAAVLLSLTSLRIVAEGGAAAGQISDIPVTIQRDSQNNITGFTFGTFTVLDSSGTARYPSAVLTHNGDILLAWAFKTASTSQVRSLRWDTATGWTNFAGTSSTPDNVIVDNSSLEWMIPNIIERQDNNNVYLLANRLSAPPSTLAYNLATWNGTSWAWGTQNLNFETNASSGVEDPVTFAWDPVASVVVVSYGITGTQSYGVFTLNSLDVKTHLDTPSLPITERDWGTISVHITTGDYYIFLMNVNTDGGSGTLGYIRHPVGGSWDSALTLLDSATNNEGLNLRAAGTSPTLDLLYAAGTSSPASIRFTRLSPFNPPNFSISASPTSVTVQAGSSGTSTLTLTSLYSFTGTVSLSATVSPSGLTASLSSASVTLTSGGTGTSTLTVSSTTSGSYIVTILAISGSLSHSTKVTVKVTDFTISSPSSLTVVTGLSKTSTITLSSLNGFAGAVGLATSVSPSGLTASVGPASVTLISGGTGTSTLTLSSNTVGGYTVTVTGTSGSLSHVVSISVTVIAPPDFSVTASPSTVTFPVGSSGTSAVTLTSLNGFTGSLTLSRTVTPSTGLTATCTSTSFTLASGGSATSNCSFSSSTTGTYAVTVSATNGTLTHSTTITVNVSDYSISANSNSQTIIASASGTSTITLTSLNSFSGAVSLALTAPAGVTASLSQNSLSLGVGGTATSTLTFSSTAIGNYTLTVTATSGSLTHSVQVTVKVVDFLVSASSTSLTIFAGQSSTTSVTLNSLGGFTGNIALTTTVSPSGLTASTNPASVALTSNGSGTSTLTVSSSTGGAYTVTATGASGGVSHSIQIIVNVVDYSISANPSTVGFQSGSNGTSTLTLTSLGGFTGSVGLSASVTPSTGLTVSCSPNSVSLTSGASATSTCTFSSSTLGTYTVTITATSGPLSHTTTVTVGVGDFTISSSSSTVTVQAGSSGTSTIILNSLAGFTGTISLSTSVTPSGLAATVNPVSVSLSPGGTASSTLNVSSSTVGTYTVTVTGTIGSLSHSVQVTVNVVDFTISTSPQSITILAGSSGTSSVQLGSLNGFAGSVTLSTSVVPSGLSASVSPSPVSLSPGGSAGSTLTVTSSVAGNYTITITSTSGSLTHSVQITVQVVDFTISANPGSLSVPAGTSSNSSISLTSINGLSGSLSLTATISPSGPVPSLSSSTVALSTGGSGSSVLTVSSLSNTSPGIYTVTITAAVGTLSHSVTVTVTVPDYSLTANPTTITFTSGSTATSTLNLASLGGFAGTVALTATVSSNGLTASLSSSNVALSAGGSGTSTLTLGSATGGSYTVTVTGTSGSSTHSVTITVNVQDFGLRTNVSSLSLVAGTSGTVTINLASISGFTGTVSLSAVCTPTGPRLSLSSSSVSLTSGGSGTSNLTIRTLKKTTPGTYTITITAISGGLTHRVTVMLTVT